MAVCGFEIAHSKVPVSKVQQHTSDEAFSVPRSIFIVLITVTMHIEKMDKQTLKVTEVLVHRGRKSVNFFFSLSLFLITLFNSHYNSCINLKQ